MDVAQQRKGEAARGLKGLVAERRVTADAEEDGPAPLQLRDGLTQAGQLRRSDVAPVVAVEGEHHVRLALELPEEQGRPRVDGRENSGAGWPQRSAGTGSMADMLASFQRRRYVHRGLKFGIFLAPFHRVGDNPTLAMDRDMELIQWLDHLGFDEAWVGEHHSAGWEIIASPELFIAAAAERTRHIRLGSGVTSLPYHHP